MIKEKKPMGSPTKWTPERTKKIAEYVESWDKYDKIPTAAGLADFIGISKQTLYIWAREKPYLSDFLKIIETKQERRLLNGGLSGEFSAGIAKMMLSKHGYRDKQEPESTEGLVQLLKDFSQVVM